MITQKQIAAIEALHDPDHYMAKFCVNPHAWYDEAMKIAAGIGLADGKILSVLDIGCGFGYFVKACEDLGHVAQGIDMRDPMIENAALTLGITYTPLFIEPGGALPASFTGYDLVTMFGVNLRHGLPDPEYWGDSFYRQLAADIRPRLNPGGRWVLRPNQTDDKSSPIARLMEPDWWQNVAGPDAIITITEHEVEIRWPQST